jgi:homoaconitase/3-isopropylmalate dehydratase large subunit
MVVSMGQIAFGAEPEGEDDALIDAAIDAIIEDAGCGPCLYSEAEILGAVCATQSTNPNIVGNHLREVTVCPTSSLRARD